MLGMFGVIKMVMGKHKGNRFELLIYKELRDLGKAQRTIGSGSSDEPGDILFETKGKLYAIECKHYKSVDWKLLNIWWKKLNNELKFAYHIGETPHFEPIVIYRENSKPIMVMCVGNINGKNVRCLTSYNLWRQTI